MIHGTRCTYRSSCRCLPCKAANAQYEASRRRLHAEGKLPLRGLIDAAMTKRLVHGMVIEGFTFTAIAKLLGVKCQRFSLHTDQVTQRTYLRVAKIYRERVAERPDAEDVDAR